jgi:hypothetical protein
MQQHQLVRGMTVAIYATKPFQRRDDSQQGNLAGAQRHQGSAGAHETLTRMRRKSPNSNKTLQYSFFLYNYPPM